MKRVKLVLYSLVLATALLALVGVEVCLAQSTPASGTHLTLTSAPRVDESGNPLIGQFTLAATLTAADGKPVTDRPISFYEQVNFLGGEKEAYLGKGSTDSTGLTGIVYQPANKGADVIIARFGGDDTYASVQASTTLDVVQVTPPIATEPVPLATVGSWLNVTVAILVVAVWGILVGVLVRTTRGIRADGGDALAAHARATRASEGHERSDVESGLSARRQW